MIISDMQRLKMLSPAEMQLIHAGACRLLAQVGVKVAHEGIAEKLRSRGARFTGGRIFLPGDGGVCSVRDGQNNFLCSAGSGLCLYGQDN